MKDDDFLIQSEMRFNNTLPNIRDGWETLTEKEKQYIISLIEPYISLKNRSREWLEGFLKAAILYIAWAMALNPPLDALVKSDTLPGMVLGLGYIDSLITKKFMEEVD